MTYYLGIDLGTTYTAAARYRAGVVEIVHLGNDGAVVPSVIFLKEDDTFLIGDQANWRAFTDPMRVAREFKRRIGYPEPMLLGVGTSFPAELLTAKLLSWVVAKVASLEGEPATAIAVTHPANWGTHKKEKLQEAIRRAEIVGVTTLTEPQAAAIYYASNARIEPGSVIAVYDLGGGTFDAAVLRKTEHSWDILGKPEGIDELGGSDFDESVFLHVRRSAPQLFADIPAAFDLPGAVDNNTLRDLARIRTDCIKAKEQLSFENDVSIPVLVRGQQAEVRLTRGEFENMIRPSIRETIGAMQRALQSAQVQPADLAAILLVGGSSRIPLIAEMVSAEFGRQVAVDAHPKHAVALGAAIAASPPEARVVPDAAPIKVDAGHESETPGHDTDPDVGANREAPVDETVPIASGGDSGPPGGEDEGGAGEDFGDESAADDAGDGGDVTMDDIDGDGSDGDGSDGGRGRSRSSGDGPRIPWIPIGAVAVIVLAAVLGFVLYGGDGDDTASGTTTSPTTGQQTTSSASESTTTATSGPECTSTSGRCVFLVGPVTEEAGAYRVSYETVGFEPLVTTTAGSFHIHFFFNTVPVLEAGFPAGHGNWFLWDVDVDGNKILHVPGTTCCPVVPGPADKGAATQLCAVVATFDHFLDEDPQASCLPLP